jgi:hypothetical protein
MRPGERKRRRLIFKALPKRQQEQQMCDYSLHQRASRPARVGDRLVSTAFTNSVTRGFSDTATSNVAVCLLPGTEVAFDREVACDRAIGFFPARRMWAKIARFRKINVDNPHAHHDALEFPDGQIVLVTRLRPGQHAMVLQLPVTADMKRVAPIETAPPPVARAVR